MTTQTIQPRIIRAGNVFEYCGMCRAQFNEHIKPHCRLITIGVQGRGYDRFELDAALDDYIERYGRAPTKQQEHEKCKKVRKLRGSSSAAASGTSTKPSTVVAFAEAVTRATGRKPSSS